MGAKIPASVAKFGLMFALKKHGCDLFKDPGKVSEMRIVPNHPDLLMIVTWPRKSIYDFVLNGLFAKTNEVITAMTVLFEGIVLKELGIPTHLVAYGKDIDKYLPPGLQNNSKLQKCALIVKKFNPDEVSTWEWIWRFCHTGSAIKSLRETGTVYGHPVRADIKEGEFYDSSLDTPTTKEDDEHDKPINRENIVAEHAAHIEFTRKIAVAVHNYFEERGIIIADLKLECTIAIAGIIYMIDKVGPDELRAWDEEDRVLAVNEGRAPINLDKERIRKWGASVPTPFKIKKGEEDIQIIGINNLDPKNPEHVAFVHGLKVPSEVIEAADTAYLELFQRANNSKDLKDFQRNVMKIAI